MFSLLHALPRSVFTWQQNSLTRTLFTRRSSQHNQVGLGLVLAVVTLSFMHSPANAAPQSSSASFVKEAPKLSQGQWPDHSQSLCFVANETDKYLAKGPSYDPAAIHGGKLPGLQTSVQRVRDTLQFICQIQQEDAAAGRVSRLTQSAFLQQHFEFVRWLPDRASALKLSKNKPLLQNIPADKILKTKYYVRIAEGSPAKTAKHPQALYGLPYDEAHLSLEEADRLGKKITRFQFGKQQILQGALEQSPQRAPALIWLSRADLEGALLQGTAVFPTGTGYRYFNVHRNNGIAYDRTLTPEQQERYWYFKEVPSVLGYGKDANYKIPVAPKVTVAGDIRQFGLGKLVLLATVEGGQLHYRLNVLADTGGAFENNQFQIDWLSGYYRDWDHYYQDNKHRADYSQAWFLLKKQ